MNDKNLKLYQAHIEKGKNGEPGEIIEITKTAIIVVFSFFNMSLI
jgi:methionyl-tRNA formyltransferase